MQLNLGPLSIGTDGIDVKPQFLVGVQAGNFSAKAGLHDVRDGLKVSAGANVKVECHSKGRSIKSLHDNLECDTTGFNAALKVAKKLFLTGEIFGLVAHILGLQKSDVEQSVKRGDAMRLNVIVSSGVGGGLEVRLGWEDTKGYHMLGAGGSAKAVVHLGANIFAGVHRNGKSLKVIVGVNNFTFEYILPY